MKQLKGSGGNNKDKNGWSHSFEDPISFLLSDICNQTINHISPLTVNMRKLRANSSSVMATVLNFTVPIFVCIFRLNFPISSLSRVFCYKPAEIFYDKNKYNQHKYTYLNFFSNCGDINRSIKYVYTLLSDYLFFRNLMLIWHG